MPPDKLYPLDVGRAFKKLAEIRGSITTYWSPWLTHREAIDKRWEALKTQ